MRFDILTLFPQALEPYLAASILGRAQEAKHIESHLWDIRAFASDKHKTTDDTPYGGGAGMVLKIEPIDRALDSINDQYPIPNTQFKKRTIVLSAKGRQFTQAMAQEYATLDQLILICGRYEGIDERVIDNLADEEISIGPYVLAGGELPAMVVLEAVARHIPGVLGNPESLSEESFVSSSTSYQLPATSSLEYPQYTKPEDYKGWKVPPVLLSGNHAEVKAWRDSQRKKGADVG